MLKSANRPEDAEASKGDTESFGQAPKDVFWLQGGKVDIFGRFCGRKVHPGV